MEKVLITGGAGFIGSHLISKLLNANNFIYCLDNLSTGNLNNIKDFIFMIHCQFFLIVLTA